jgi:IS5 family transposase
MGKQVNLFGGETQLKRLSKLGDPLEKVGKAIDWEMFRPLLKQIRKNATEKGGRPSQDEVMMFKIVMLQQWYALSDDSAEYMINDRLSFQRFLGLELGEKSPDSKTIWVFKEALGKKDDDASIARRLFDKFNAELESEGIITHKGSMIDATFVDAPRQRNTPEENKAIKEGKIPEGWRKSEKVNKLAQKDIDARWAKKGDETHYGFKDHAKVDRDSKIVTDFSVTSANIHDVNEFEGLVDAKDQEIWLDAGYTSNDIVTRLREKYPLTKIHICEKGKRNHPLTDEQKASNRVKSKIRARVEHVFGYMTRFMGGITVRGIGITRANRDICHKNLAYNMKRAAFLATVTPVLA